MDYRTFDNTQTSLNPGITLIEASAGTGKTYAIAMLALRFIVELDVAIDKVLMVTFTNAATEELKTRVRQRVFEAKQALSGQLQETDATLSEWLNNLNIEPEIALTRLNNALLNIDQACIFTIHGFCQRLLQEYALESGQLFDVELCADIAAIKQSCTDDFWRKQVYQRDIEHADILLQVAKSPDALLASIGNVTDLMTIEPKAESLDLLLPRYVQLITGSRAAMLERIANLSEVIKSDHFNKNYRQAFQDAVIALQNFAENTNQSPPPLQTLMLLTREQIIKGLNGVKFRNSKTASSTEKIHNYLEQINIKPHALDTLPEIFQRIHITFRRLLLDDLRVQLPLQMQKLNLFSFDELISRVSQVLKLENAENLHTAVRENYRVALIDEFQDTDAQQWHIFSTLFADPSHYLYLIGDPKQAIYKFRGADIFTYFFAQKQADFQYTLEHNWRSHPDLVLAVNTLFTLRPQPFLFEMPAFHPVKAALQGADGEILHRGKSTPPMQLWHLPESDAKSGYWSANKAGTDIQIAVINEIVALLNPEHIFRINKQASGSQALVAEDIAILVHSNQQASEYQALLRHTGVPSVVNSTVSVFATVEAMNLYRLLSAIAHPGDIGLLKQALTITWFNLTAQDMLTLNDDERLLDFWLNQLQQFHQQWLEHGLMQMMLTLLEQLNIHSNIASCIDAERQLTNIYHLLELIQEAVIEKHFGLHKSLDWLYQAITTQENNEHLQLRLESDRQAVKIITMHRAKGLEYPVVFCPYLWQRHEGLKKEKYLITCYEDNSLIADLGSDKFEQRRTAALKEELAEHLRLLYVALTRAKYRCYIVWADVRSIKQRNQSAFDYLLFQENESDFSEQQTRLMQICSKAGVAMEYRCLDIEPALSVLPTPRSDSLELHCKAKNRNLQSHWQMSSYTALSALSINDTPELPSDQAQEAEDTFPEDTTADNELPKGAITGNVVHYLLETNAFADIARQDLNAEIQTACHRFGLELQQPKAMQALLRNSVSSPLSEQDAVFCLQNLDESVCLKEMPFYLALSEIDTEAVNALLKNSPDYQTLSGKQIQGFLTGFIDLICRYQDRYYVIDYKTNTLSDYSDDNLTKAMRAHNYGLQYWIYTLVLHRYLQNRLPDYDYTRHFGGVKYLFVRGMTPGKPMQGVFETVPHYHTLTALEQLFGVCNAKG